MNKICINAMEYYLVTQRSEVLTHATTQVSLGNTTRSERNLSQKTTKCMSPFTGNVQNRKDCGGRNYIQCFLRAGRGGWEDRCVIARGKRFISEVMTIF